MIRNPTLRDYLGLSVFWLAMNFFWGAMLFVVVQSRVRHVVERELPAVARAAALSARPEKKAGAASSHSNRETPESSPGAAGGAPELHPVSSAQSKIPRVSTGAAQPGLSGALRPPFPRPISPAPRSLQRGASSGSSGAGGLRTPSAKSRATLTPATAARRIERETNRRLGWMLGIGALVSTLTQLLFGAISDNSHHRMGRRRPFLIAGVLLSNFGVYAFMHATSYFGLFFFYLYLQFFLSIAIGPYQALLPDLIPLEHEGTASAYMGLWQLFGRAGGMTAGALLLTRPWGLGALGILFLVCLNSLMAVTVVLTRERPLRHRFPGGVGGSLAKLFRAELIRHPSFLWVLASRLSINMGIYTVMPFIQYYLMHVFHLTELETLHKQEIIGVIVNVAGVSAAFPAGVLSDRFSKKRILMVACSVCIAAGVGFAISGSVTMALMAAAVFGFGYGAFQSVDWALVCNVLPPGQPAKYMGLWSFGDTIPQIVAPMFGYLLVNAIIGHYGAGIGYRSAMAAAMIWFSLGTFFIRYVREHHAHAQSTELQKSDPEENTTQSLVA